MGVNPISETTWAADCRNNRTPGDITTNLLRQMQVAERHIGDLRVNTPVIQGLNTA